MISRTCNFPEHKYIYIDDPNILFNDLLTFQKCWLERIPQNHRISVSGQIHWKYSIQNSQTLSSYISMNLWPDISLPTSLFDESIVIRVIPCPSPISSLPSNANKMKKEPVTSRLQEVEIKNIAYKCAWSSDFDSEYQYSYCIYLEVEMEMQSLVNLISKGRFQNRK